MKATVTSRCFFVVLLFAAIITTFAATRRQDDPAELLLQSAIQKEMIDGDLAEAIALYRKVAASYGNNRPEDAISLLRIGMCYEKLGGSEARKGYKEVLSRYGDQSEVAEKARGLAALEKPAAATAPAGLTVRRVWTGDTSGSISPDGRYLTLTSRRQEGILKPFNSPGGCILSASIPMGRRSPMRRSARLRREKSGWWTAFSNCDRRRPWISKRTKISGRHNERT